MKRWCLWCGEELKRTPWCSWVHLNGMLYKPGRPYPVPVETNWKASEKGQLGEFYDLALGCLEDAKNWLEEINKRFPEHIDAECDNPFWSEAYESVNPLSDILTDLEGIADENICQANESLKQKAT